MNKGKCLFMRLALIIGLIVQSALLQASALIDGLYYDLDESNHTATVTYETTGSDNCASLPADVVIPANVTYGGVTYSVTKIGDKAFANCTSMESISIPATVVQIGTLSSYSDDRSVPKSLPFYNCTSLKEVRFEDGQQPLSLCAFTYITYRYDSNYNKVYYPYDGGYHSGLFVSCPIEKVYIGRNIENLAYKAYPFEEKPQYYGYSAFYKQTKLKSVTISSSVTELPRYLFSGCSSLETLTIEGGLMAIPSHAFEGGNLSSVILPNSIGEISDYAFQNNAGLKAVDLGKSVKSIGNYAFDGCDLSSVLCPNSLENIGDYSFNGNSNLKTVTLNSGLLTIGDAAFANSSLETISIPGTVTQIGTAVIKSGTEPTLLPFYNCSSLKEVRFEDGEQPIELGSFCRYYKNGTSNSSPWVYDVNHCYGLFTSCPLENVYVGRNIKYSENNNYSSFSSKPEYYGYSAFYNQPKLAKITISPSVTEIAPYLFYKNGAITMTELPNVKVIGRSAFEDCSKLTTLNLGQDLETVGDCAFQNCTNVTKLTFPDATTRIGSSAFARCSSVTEITVGQGLKSVGDYSFFDCGSFTALVLPDKFTTMGESAFEGCRKLTNAKLGQSLASVPNSAFKNCIALSEMNLPATVKSVGDQAFYNDSTIAVVTMREGLETIGKEVFWNNSGIRSFGAVQIFGVCMRQG